MTDILTTLTEVYELVLQTDEAYYHAGLFTTREAAERIAATGNARMEQRDRDLGLGMRVRSRVLSNDDGAGWTVEQIKEELEDQVMDVNDWFLPETEEED